MAVHTQRPSVIMHADKMPKVPRRVGSGSQWGIVALLGVYSPNIVLPKFSNVSPNASKNACAIGACSRHPSGKAVLVIALALVTGVTVSVLLFETDTEDSGGS